MPAPDSPSIRHRTFSLSTMLMAITIGCLAMALFLANRRLAEYESELKFLRPLPVDELARDFEQKTSQGPVSTYVTDIRCSANGICKLTYTWTIDGSNQYTSTEIILSHDGYGTYYCKIREQPLAKLLGNQNGVDYTFQTPPAFKR